MGCYIVGVLQDDGILVYGKGLLVNRCSIADIFRSKKEAQNVAQILKNEHSYLDVIILNKLCSGERRK